MGKEGGGGVGAGGNIVGRGSQRISTKVSTMFPISMSRLQNIMILMFISSRRRRGGGYSIGIWVGGFGRLNKTLTLLKTQQMSILLPCLRESAVILTLLKTGPSITVFRTIKPVYISLHFHTFQWRHTKSAKILWSKGEKQNEYPWGITPVWHLWQNLQHFPGHIP